jgi:hypothetical protein
MIYKNNLGNRIIYSYVLGRFSKKTASYFQYFPISNWHNEFKIAKKLGFNGVEWIISDLSNPIFNKIFRKIIIKNLKKNKIKICSIFLDFIMRKPLYEFEKNELIWIVEQIKILKKEFKFKRLTIPIEETCRYKNQIQKKKTLDALNFLLINLKSNLKFTIETDLKLNEIEKVLNDKRFKDLGLLIDLGNIRASNRRIQDYLNKFSDRIFSIHVKFRDKNWGKSAHIPKDFFELKYIKQNFHRLKKINDITFQTYRSNNRFLSDMKRSIKNFNENIKK